MKKLKYALCFILSFLILPLVIAMNMFDVYILRLPTDFATNCSINKWGAVLIIYMLFKLTYIKENSEEKL